MLDHTYYKILHNRKLDYSVKLNYIYYMSKTPKYAKIKYGRK